MPPCASGDAAPDPLPAPRRGESAAHLLLKRLTLAWAQNEGYQSCAFEVGVPKSRYRADVAAYLPTRTLLGAAIGRTAIFECKQSRQDFLKDSRSAHATAAELRELHERRAALEIQLRVHHPSLRVNDSLFQDYWSHDLTSLEHSGYRVLLARIAVLQNRLFRQTKFDTLVRYRCGNLYYVVAEHGIFEPQEVPVGWGLLVRRGEGLELLEKPVWHDLQDHERLALLHRIAAAGTRTLNREAGIRRVDGPGAGRPCVTIGI